MNLFRYILEIQKKAELEISKLSSEISFSENVKIELSKKVDILFLVIIFVMICIILKFFLEEYFFFGSIRKSIIVLILGIFTLGICYIMMYDVAGFYTSLERKKIREKWEKEVENRSKIIQNQKDDKIRKIYNSNINLFDNYKTNNIDEILKKVKEKEELFNKEVDRTIKDMKKKAYEKDIFLDDKQIRPFVELYIINKNNIPLYEKIEQNMNSETAGKVCKALEIKNCFENSSFEKYNAEIKGKEEENKTTKNNNGLLNTSFLFWFIK